VRFIRVCEEISYSRAEPQMTVWHMKVACWVTMSTNTYSECVVLIVFPLQQWL
jgi:hypothetical protein